MNAHIMPRDYSLVGLEAKRAAELGIATPWTLVTKDPASAALYP